MDTMCSVAVRTLKTIPGDLKGGGSLNQENPFHRPSDSSNPFGVPGSFMRPNENRGNAPKSNNDQNRASNSDKPTPPEEHGFNRDHRDSNDHSDLTSPEEHGSNPFIVPGHERSESKSTIGGSQTRIKHPTGVKEGSIDQHDHTDGSQELPTRTASPSRQGDVHHTPFVWGVPNKPTKAEQEADLGNEINQPSVKSPASPDHGNGDGNHGSTQIDDDNDKTSDGRDDHDAPVSPFRPVASVKSPASPDHGNGDGNHGSTQIDDDNDKTSDGRDDHDAPVSPFRPVDLNPTMTSPTHETGGGGSASGNAIDHSNHTDHHNQRSQQSVADLHEHKVLGDQPEVPDSHSDLHTDVESHGSASTGVLDVDHHPIKQDTRNMQEASTDVPAASDHGSSDRSQNAGANPRLDARQTAAFGVSARRRKVNTSGVDYSGPAASDHGSSDRSQNAGANPRLDARQTAAFGVSARRRKVNTSGVDYSGLLDGIEDPTEDEDNDDPFGINGFNEEWSDTPDDDPLLGGFNDSSVDGGDSIDDGDDDDPFGINGYLDDETDGDGDSTAIRDDTGGAGDHNGVVNGTHGGNVSIDLNQHNVKLEHDRSRINMDALTARSHVDVSGGGSYAVDQSKLREGVQIGTVKRELKDFIHNPKIVDKAIARKIQLLEYKKKTRIPFSPKIPKMLDFLTRWRIGTTLQLARIAGWKDSNERRLVKKLRVYDEVGFMRETDIYAGPKIWTAKDYGAEFGMHPWLGGVKSSEINPMSQSHTFGLSSIASWLLCPGDNAPNILGLAPDEWNQVRGEIKDGTAYVLAEKEYRSSYSSIRTASKGLLPSEYRHGFIGYAGGQLNPVSGAWQEWALAYKNGDATLGESPELLACDPEFMGANLWMWIIWGNSVWNPKVLEDRASMEEGIDLDDPEWSGRDGELRLRSEFRRYGYVDIEERLDYATNKPMINKELGDRFALWDHLPDMIIARRRTDDGYADPQSIAIELELSAKSNSDAYARTMAAYGSPLGQTLYRKVIRTDDGYADPQSIAIELELSAKSNSDAYARTMAAYGSPLGQTLYRKVIWLVSSKTIADRIRAGANKVGMILGEDYDIVPFVTSNKVSVVRKSFYSGADILPGKWSKRGIIEPCEFDRSIPLS